MTGKVCFYRQGLGWARFSKVRNGHAFQTFSAVGHCCCCCMYEYAAAAAAAVSAGGEREQIDSYCRPLLLLYVRVRCCCCCCCCCFCWWCSHGTIRVPSISTQHRRVDQNFRLSFPISSTAIQSLSDGKKCLCVWTILFTRRNYFFTLNRSSPVVQW